MPTRRRPAAGTRKMTTPSPGANGVGAPLAITRVLEAGRDGRPDLTAGQRFLDMVRLGQPVQIAAAAAGVSAYATVQAIKDGAKVSELVDSGDLSEEALTRHQRICLEFSRDFTRATGEAIAVHAAILGQVVRGGGQVTTRTTTRKVVNGVEETTEVVRTEVLGSDPATLRWYLERRWPEHFGTKITLGFDPGLDPTHVTDDDHIDRILELVQTIPGPHVIETTTTETRP